MQLTEKQQSLITVAAFAAQGNLPALTNALHTALDRQLTVSQLKEELSHVYAYVGFPRSLNALATLQQVIDERKKQGLPILEGKEATPLPQDYNALEQGTRVQTQLVGGNPFNYTFAPQTDYYLKAHLFGDIFARDVLAPNERELVTIGAIATLKGCEAQLTSHCAGALNMGVSADELKQVPVVLSTTVGQEEAYRAKASVEAVLKDKLPHFAQPTDSMPPSHWQQGEFNAAYAQYFTGKSYLAPYDTANGGPVNVTFEPRCRNNWHIHHHSVQVLICVAGRGWYVEEGKEPLEMTPGTVVAIPTDVKHWHGAACDSWFQHLTYMANVGEGAGTTWLDPVTDEEYNLLP